MMTEGRNLDFIWLYEEGIDEKISYERRDYAAVAGKQQFSILRTKLPPLVIAGGKGLRSQLIGSLLTYQANPYYWQSTSYVTCLPHMRTTMAL